MESLISNNWWLIVLILSWTIPWKLVALYKSARNGHKIWFIVVFFINTLAILEICYIYLIDGSKKKSK